VACIDKISSYIVVVKSLFLKKFQTVKKVCCSFSLNHNLFYLKKRRLVYFYQVIPPLKGKSIFVGSNSTCNVK